MTMAPKSTAAAVVLKNHNLYEGEKKREKLQFILFVKLLFYGSSGIFYAIVGLCVGWQGEIIAKRNELSAIEFDRMVYLSNFLLCSNEVSGYLEIYAKH